MTNLVINAHDAMPNGSAITISTQGIEIELSPSATVDGQELEPGAYVKLTVSDTGTGMDEETRQHLFEPFFTTKPLGKGTGLGLSIVFGIVSQLRGSICVSTQLGEGTVFTICLPTTTEQQTEKLPGSPATRARAKQEITLLLVEADHGVRHLVRHMLLKAGHAVYETSDPREAAGICETTEVNLLLTDLVMPAMNGAELAVSLMKTHGELRVLYMSGCIDDSILPSRCLESGVHFIRKPFSAASLSKQIEAIFNVGPEQDQLLHASS